MKAILTFPACNRSGGVERVLVECANFLASRGHDVSVISAQLDSRALMPAVHGEVVPAAGRFRTTHLRAYQRNASAKLKVLSGGAACAHGAFGVVCPPEGVLWVQAVHAEWIRIARSNRSFAGRLKQRLNPFHPFILKRERQYYRGRRYRKLLALTPRVKTELMEHYGVPDADVEILPNGYNPQEFSVARRAAERDAVRSELGFSDADRVLVFVANELERKGFFPLAEALASLKSPQIKLLVVGRGAVSADWLKSKRMEQQIRCVGPSPDVGRYYAAADFFVLPTYYEAWGLVIIEALASGLPVLTSRLAGASVAVQQNRTGLLLDNPRNPAEIAAGLSALLQTGFLPAEEISRSVLEFQWSTILTRYESILAQHCN